MMVQWSSGRQREEIGSNPAPFSPNEIHIAQDYPDDGNRDQAGVCKSCHGMDIATHSLSGRFHRGGPCPKSPGDSDTGRS